MRFSRALAVAVMGLALIMAGCANNEDTEAGGKGFNDADVAFATDMIQHHAQALQMVDLTMGRKLDPEVEQLAEEIRAAQAPEIEKMAAWLQDWDQPVPETVRDHSNAEGGDMDMDMDSDMPGMMSGEEMQSLGDASDAEFPGVWLEMMIAHHEGAIEMAEEEQASGEFPEAVSLAEEIAAGQADQVATMQDLANE